MPVINSGNVLTLADWAKSLGPDGQVTADVVEMLNQTNEVLLDMGWMEGNLPVGHQGEIRTGLPPSYYRAMNQPVPVGKSTKAPIMEQTAMLEAYTQVDKKLANLGGPANRQKMRMSEGKAQTESFNQTFVKTLFYGSVVNPAAFIGFSTRYGAISGATNAQNILDAGGTGSNNASIWLCVWGEDKVTGIFPQGTKAGIVHEDLGEETAQGAAYTDGSPQLMQVYRDHWEWDHGLYLADWRYVVRIANIDIPALLAKSGAAADILELMLRATRHVPNLRGGRPAFYMNRTVAEMMDVQMRDAVKQGGQLKYEVVDGVDIPVFRGCPVRIVDQLLNTESRVV